MPRRKVKIPGRGKENDFENDSDEREISRWYFSFVPILFTHETHGYLVKFYFIVFYRRKFVAQIQFKKVAFPFSKHLKFSIYRSNLSLLQVPLPFDDVRSLGSEVVPRSIRFFYQRVRVVGVILLRTKDNFIVCIRLKKKKKKEKKRERAWWEAREQCRCCKTNAITSRNETNLSRTGKWLASWSNKLRQWGRFSTVACCSLSSFFPISYFSFRFFDNDF